MTRRYRNEHLTDGERLSRNARVERWRQSNKAKVLARRRELYAAKNPPPPPPPAADYRAETAARVAMALERRKGIYRNKLRADHFVEDERTAEALKCFRWELLDVWVRR